MATHILREKKALEFEAVFDKATMERIESAFTGQAEGVMRRAALAVLTRSKAELTKEMDPRRAEALMAVAENLTPYIKRLEGFLECMRSAQARLFTVLGEYTSKAA